jgi:CubicO group peptidase (beta-lactamase class C family)
MKKVLISFVTLIGLLVVILYVFVYPRFIIISGYAAKNLCSCVFVAGIEEEKALSEDLNFNIISLATTDVNYDKKTVTASVFGLNPKTAYFQGSTGCTLVNKIKPDQAYEYTQSWEIPKYDSLESWFSYIDTVEYLSENQADELRAAMAKAFIEDNPSVPLKNTRAALVLYKGQLVAEQYAPGFDKSSRLMGWSMSKSLTATMLSLLAQDGKVDLDATTEIQAWQDDERKNITYRHLLHMNSGLRWEEVYDGMSDAVVMLFDSDAIGEYATQLPQTSVPDAHWVYSSGTSNILASRMHGFFDDTDSYIRYPYERLFYKIGMYSMLMETDASGHFVGSSYSWATARDWAKMGQLYLQDGNWAGEQVLDKEWVKFVQQPALNSNDIYGGHFWLNKGKRFPDVPTDLYSMDGFHGQKVFIIPSKDLVVVRLGLTYNEADFDFNLWLKEIILATDS